MARIEVQLQVAPGSGQNQSCQHAQDNIEPGKCRGSGADKADELEEIAYEGYAMPAVLRWHRGPDRQSQLALSEIRYVLSRGNGVMVKRLRGLAV